MGYGVILNQLSNVKTKAQFYVPILRPDSPINSSHVYYNEDLNGLSFQSIIDLVPETTTVIVNLPQDLCIDEFVNLLNKHPRRYAIFVPIEQNLRYWRSLRDASRQLADSKIDLILTIQRDVSMEFLQRFKCLDYTAVFLTKPVFDKVHYLLHKSTRPNLLVDQDVANGCPFRFWHELAHPALDLGLDLLIDPLQPLTEDMELDVYETFESDKTKYRQYDHAIEMAIGDLRLKKATINILVIGAGRGPLLSSVIAHADTVDTITVLEKNSKCLPSLVSIAQGNDNIAVHHDDVRNLQNVNKFDLIVSELLGSFGCNEACPEILQMFADCGAVMIPESYKSFIQPVFSCLHKLSNFKRPYLINFSASISCCGPELVFSFSHPGINQLSQESEVNFGGDREEVANAICGYFEAQLYGPYKIGNHPKLSAFERCTSWFPMAFPIEEERYLLKVKVLRVSDTNLRYEWEVNGVRYGNSSKGQSTEDYRVLL